jgi:hypothetical protein
MKKHEDEILVNKPRPLSMSLTIISDEDNKTAIRIFEHLLKIIDEVKIDNVFRLIEGLIEICQRTSPEVKN